MIVDSCVAPIEHILDQNDLIIKDCVCSIEGCGYANRLVIQCGVSPVEGRNNVYRLIVESRVAPIEHQLDGHGVVLYGCDSDVDLVHHIIHIIHQVEHICYCVASDNIACRVSQPNIETMFRGSIQEVNCEIIVL